MPITGANLLAAGADYLPFAEIPSLRNMVLTGEDDGDMSYMRLQERTLAQGALPPSRSHGNADMVQYRGGGIDGDRGQRGGYGGGGREDQRRYDRRGGGVDDYDDDYGAQRPRDDVRNVEPKRGGYDSYYDEDAAAGSRGGGGGGSRHPQQRYRDEREYDDDDGVPFDDRVVPSSRRYDNTSYESAAGGRAARDAGYEYGRGGTTGYGGTRSGQSSRR